jgi:hypothetical protein
MNNFKDANGLAWELALDIVTAKRVKSTLGVDLLADVDAVLIKLGDDLVLLVDVLYVLCRPQADARKLSDEDFGRALRGDSIESAALALMQEIADFFPHRKQAALRKLLDKSQDLATRTLDLIDERIEAFDPQAQVEQLAARLKEQDRLSKSGRPSSPPKTGAATAGGTPTSSPESSESSRAG